MIRFSEIRTFSDIPELQDWRVCREGEKEENVKEIYIWQDGNGRF